MDNKADKRILKTFDVAIDETNYDILIGKRIIELLPALLKEATEDKRVILVYDSFFQTYVQEQLVPGLAGEGFIVFAHPLPGGKLNKNIKEAISIYGLLEAENFARDSTLVALGGGVIGDMAGFVAATYLRGINLVHIPTTMTAMIDSSIGGKVAINFKKTVNAIGSYYHPIANLIDLEFARTLPDRDFKAGLAEIIKCAIIRDRGLFEFLIKEHAGITGRETDPLLHIMARAIEIKLQHVTGDIREQNKRLKLNYGHTIGHAIETSTSVFSEVYRHGEGVSLGMVGAAHVARDYYGGGEEILERHEEILSLYGLPTRVKTVEIEYDKVALKEECLLNIEKDKKRKSGKLRFILPLAIGDCATVDDVDQRLVERAFDYLLV